MKTMKNLYDEHDGEKLKLDADSWNTDYMDSQMVKAVNTFSKERVDLLKHMVRYIYRDKINK